MTALITILNQILLNGDFIYPERLLPMLVSLELLSKLLMETWESLLMNRVTSLDWAPRFLASALIIRLSKISNSVTLIVKSIVLKIIFVLTAP